MPSLKTLEEVFRGALGLQDDTDPKETAYGETEEWHSVAHMLLVAAIEEAFDIMMDTDDVIAMSSFSVAQDLLKENYGISLDA